MIVKHELQLNLLWRIIAVVIEFIIDCSVHCGSIDRQQSKKTILHGFLEINKSGILINFDSLIMSIIIIVKLASLPLITLANRRTIGIRIKIGFRSRITHGKHVNAIHICSTCNNQMGQAGICRSAFYKSNVVSLSGFRLCQIDSTLFSSSIVKPTGQDK